KKVFSFDAPVDSGLASWASEYLNERLVGMDLGARMLHARLHDEGLSAGERAFVERLAPAFTSLATSIEESLYVEGAAHLLKERSFADLSELNELMTMLERRVVLLGLLREALGRRDVLVRI